MGQATGEGPGEELGAEGSVALGLDREGLVEGQALDLSGFDLGDGPWTEFKGMAHRLLIPKTQEREGDLNLLSAWVEEVIGLAPLGIDFIGAAGLAQAEPPGLLILQRPGIEIDGGHRARTDLAPH